MMQQDFTLLELARAVTGGNEAAMRKLLYDAGARELDVDKSDPLETVDRGVVVHLFALRAGDRVGRSLIKLLGCDGPN